MQYIRSSFLSIIVILIFTLFCGCGGKSQKSSSKTELGIRNCTDYNYIEVNGEKSWLNKGEVKYFHFRPADSNYIHVEAGGKKALLSIYSRRDGKVYPNFNLTVHKVRNGIRITSLFEDGMVLDLIEREGHLFLTNNN